MSVSYSVVAIKPPTSKKWQKMKAVFDSCREAGINVPTEVWDFFDGAMPDPDGVVVEVETEEGNDYGPTWTVDLTKLPPNATKLRFEAHY